ncbi:hypothetical protein VTK73DRAFT_3592 [Phialemonium thermophilum]|uniref:Uncharacterized protein n=1 Tax=Phialemonium thermophilum TaxID=223376 RepID=A0ABR3WY90_9PEZI
MTAVESRCRYMIKGTRVLCKHRYSMLLCSSGGEGGLESTLGRWGTRANSEPDALHAQPTLLSVPRRMFTVLTTAGTFQQPLNP